GYGSVSYFFLFPAEDGIRDFHVTGVQTCALPIYPWFKRVPADRAACELALGNIAAAQAQVARSQALYDADERGQPGYAHVLAIRSEERRVGKEGRARWRQEHWSREEWRAAAGGS